MKNSQTLYNIYMVPILKSIQGGDADSDLDYIRAEVEGVATDDSPDLVNEIVNQEGISDIYVKGGFARIKNEHSKDPSDFIGFVKSIRRIGNATSFKGEFFAKKGTPQYPIAKSVIGDIQNVIEWNKLNPGNPKQVGWSIEGLAVKVGEKYLKTLLSSIVYTTAPMNPRATMTSFAKSLMSDYSNHSGGDSGLQSGGAALRPEQINNQTNGVRDMEFKSYADAFKYFKGQGNTDDEARKKADEWKKSRADKDNSADAELANAVGEMEKSLASAGKIGEMLVDLAKSISSVGNNNLVSINKSMAAHASGDKDAMAMAFKSSFETQEKAFDVQARSAELLGLAQIEGQKVLSALAKSVNAIIRKQERLSEENDSLANAVFGLVDLNLRLLKGQGIEVPATQIQKSATGSPDGNQPVAKDPVLVQSALERGVSEGKLQPRDSIGFAVDRSLSTDATAYLKSAGI